MAAILGPRSPIAESVGVSTQEQQESRASILLASGDSSASARVAAILRESGHAVREALDVPEALAALDLAVPDLLILDLPGVQGHTLLEALRSHPIRSTMAILALDGQQAAAGLLEAGVDDVLPLPLNQEMLRIKVRALIRLKHAERAARELVGRRARDQHALQRAGERLAACPTLFEVLTVAAELVRGNLGYDRVSIAHFDSAARTLRYVVGTDDQGRVYGPIDPPLTVSLGEGSPLRDLPAYHALFLQGQETYYVPDTAGRAPAYFRPALDGPVRESLLVAMRVGDQVVGLITVDNLPSGRPFAPDDSGLLATLARQVGVAVLRAGQAEALQARAEDAEGLARAGAVLSSILDPDQVLEELLDQAARLLPYDHGTVLLRDGEWARIAAARAAAPLPAGTHVLDMRGPGGDALIDGTTLSLADVTIDPLWRDFPLWAGEHRIRALILAPLILDGEFQGVLCLASFQARAYGPRHRDVAAALTERAAAALRTARLFTAERSRLIVPAASSAASAVAGDLDALTAFVAPGEESAPSAHMLENLRILTLLDVGALKLAADPVNLRALTEMVIAHDDALHDRLVVDGPDDTAALADPGYTALILENLLDNAARYSPAGSQIKVAWTVADRTAMLRVTDHGHGIPAGGRRHLFARFAWTPAGGENPTAHGVGLGLYLSRALAEAMDGALELESTSRKGSTFRLSLPVLPD